MKNSDTCVETGALQKIDLMQLCALVAIVSKADEGRGYEKRLR